MSIRGYIRGYIHTHYDAEVLAAPSLSESVRHGVTTVLMGSCSLSTVHVDAVQAADLFGRVEAIRMIAWWRSCVSTNAGMALSSTRKRTRGGFCWDVVSAVVV